MTGRRMKEWPRVQSKTSDPVTKPLTYFVEIWRLRNIQLFLTYVKKNLTREHFLLLYVSCGGVKTQKRFLGQQIYICMRPCAEVRGRWLKDPAAQTFRNYHVVGKSLSLRCEWNHMQCLLGPVCGGTAMSLRALPGDLSCRPMSGYFQDISSISFGKTMLIARRCLQSQACVRTIKGSKSFQVH